jgi:hypothetical protein
VSTTETGGHGVDAAGAAASDGNDIKTKGERSFDLVFVFNIEAK